MGALFDGRINFSFLQVNYFKEFKFLQVAALK